MLLPGALPWARRPGAIPCGAKHRRTRDKPRPTPTCRRGLPAPRARNAAQRSALSTTHCRAWACAREAEAAPRAPREARRTRLRTARLAATTPRVPSDMVVVAGGAATTATTANTVATAATAATVAGKAPPPPAVGVLTGVINHRPLNAHRPQPLLLRTGPWSRMRRRRRRKRLQAAPSTRWRRSSTRL